jgi:polyphosphate kinase
MRRLLKAIESSQLRQWGQVIRLEAEDSIDDELLSVLTRSLSIQPPDIFLINGPLDLTFLFRVQKLPLDPALRFAPYVSQPIVQLQTDDLFAAIRQSDVLLHHPYESFDPVIELVRQASEVRMSWPSSRPCNESPENRDCPSSGRSCENGKKFWSLSS